MKTKIIVPRDRAEEVFRFLLSKEMTFEFCYRVECSFIIPHIPPLAVREILKHDLPLSRTVELSQFSAI